jgi:monoamine oxidase
MAAKNITRRALLRNIGMGIGAALVPSQVMWACATPRGWTQEYDVAIIGGGISGVYCGWRLIGADGNSRPRSARLVVCERSPRIGGRLNTLVPPKMPNLRAEIGGMRYTTTQPLIRSLVEKQLRLPWKGFPVSNPNTLNYLRGRHLHNSDFADPAKVPYNLLPSEQGKTGLQLILQGISTVVPGAERFTARDWQNIRERGTLDGVPLYQLGFWNTLMRALSMEAISLGIDARGYDHPTYNWNAVEAMIFFYSDYAQDVQYRTPVAGYMEVPVQLAREFQAAGGEIRLRHELRSFTWDPKRQRFHLILDAVGRREEMWAQSLILAMPRRSLELVADQSPLLRRPEVQQLIHSVIPEPMFKIFTCYPRPWWEDVGLHDGETVTDLPIRQCYYFGTVNKQPTVPSGQADNTSSLLMASYDDGRNVGFWEGLRGGDQHAGAVELLDDPTDVERWREHAAPARMVAEVQRQLKLIHGLEKIPDAYAAAFQYWGDDPYGGATNRWLPGVQAWVAAERMIQPLAHIPALSAAPLYVCGEAYSLNQGWVEGALSTAENLLQTRFKLAPPSWARAT